MSLPENSLTFLHKNIEEECNKNAVLKRLQPAEINHLISLLTQHQFDEDRRKAQKALGKHIDQVVDRLHSEKKL